MLNIENVASLCCVDKDAAQVLNEDRQHLHRFPELSMQEYQTAAWLCEQLENIGLVVKRVGETGLVAVLENGAGPVVAYRADTDGLPVQEETGLAFASQARATLNGVEVPVMHACGHDVHMAVALGIARQLMARRDAWRGTVVLIFQPGEEIAAGAKYMVEHGLWEKVPKPEIIFGMHVMPYTAGKVFIPVGTAMSMGDSWGIAIRGRGAHGSQPEESIDPVVLGASLVMRLQTIISREIAAKETAVVTVGTFHAGVKENVIPEEAYLTVNIRTFEPEVRDRVLSAVRRIVSAEAAASGAPEPLVRTISEFPRCYNDPDETRRTLEDLSNVLGHDRVAVSEPHMASEDFGYLGESIGAPSVFWFLGGTSQEEIDTGRNVSVNHSPKFAPIAHPTLEAGVTAGLAALFARLSSP